jgi:hypothetical protein
LKFGDFSDLKFEISAISQIWNSAIFQTRHLKIWKLSKILNSKFKIWWFFKFEIQQIFNLAIFKIWNSVNFQIRNSVNFQIQNSVIFQILHFDLNLNFSILNLIFWIFTAVSNQTAFSFLTAYNPQQLFSQPDPNQTHP